MNTRLTEWKCPGNKLDLNESLDLLDHFFDKAALDHEPGTREPDITTLTVNLSNVTFCTLLGTVSLATVVSKIVSLNGTIHLVMPSEEKPRERLTYYGLPALLARSRSVDAVTIDNLSSISSPAHDKRVFHTRPVFLNADLAEYYKPGNIRGWLNQLSHDVQQTALFRHGRFSRIFTAELCKNIVEHAKLASRTVEGREAFGVSGMRVIKVPETDPIGWVYSSFDADLREFVSEHAHTGFAELCVCDPGIGIRATLEESFSRRISQVSHQPRPKCKHADADFRRSVEIIQFAFDELGTSKEEVDRWLTDDHALTTILWLTQTYGGVLSVTTSNARVRYRLDQ